jgi:hypothetical protein
MPSVRSLSDFQQSTWRARAGFNALACTSPVRASAGWAGVETPTAVAISPKGSVTVVCSPAQVTEAHPHSTMEETFTEYDRRRSSSST